MSVKPENMKNSDTKIYLSHSYFLLSGFESDLNRFLRH